MGDFKSRNGFSSEMSGMCKTGHGPEKAGGKEFSGIYKKGLRITEKYDKIPTRGIQKYPCSFIGKEPSDQKEVQSNEEI